MLCSSEYSHRTKHKTYFPKGTNNMKSRQNTLANYEKDCPGIPVHVLVSDLYNNNKKQFNKMK